MQPVVEVFAALLLAHLLADFLLQPDRLVRNKGRKISALLLHGGIHYAAAWGCLVLFSEVRLLAVRNQAIVAVCMLLHLGIDRSKSALTGRGAVRDNGWLFLADQILHVAVLGGAAVLITRSRIADGGGWAGVSPAVKDRILEGAIVYVGIVFGGGYLIRYLTRGAAEETGSESQAQLENAGLYIGWLERALVLTAILMQSPALVGLILTGKSIARFPEFKEARFAEYFLIGTLLSFALAMLGGIVLLKMLYGSVSLK